jgi:hypothetical protein
MKNRRLFGKGPLTKLVFLISLLVLMFLLYRMLTPRNDMPHLSEVIHRENTDKVVQLALLDTFEFLGDSEVTISPDSKYIVYGVLKTINVQKGIEAYYDAEDLATSHFWEGQHGPETAINFVQGSEELLIGFEDGTLIRMRFDGTVIWETIVQPGIRQISYSTAAKKLAVLSQEIVTEPDSGLVQFIQLEDGTMLESVKGTGVDFLPDGNHFILGTGEGFVELWTSSPFAVEKVLDRSNFNTTAILVSPDGSIVLATSDNQRSSGDVRLIRIEDSYYITALSATMCILDIAFSPDSQLIATSSECDNTVQLWGGKDGYMLSRLVGHTGPVTSVEFSSDGKFLVTGSTDGTIRLWGIPE